MAMSSESKFEGLFEVAGDAYVGVDATGSITLMNSQAERLFGYQRDELIGQPVEILVPDAVREIHSVHRTQYVRRSTTRHMGSCLEVGGRRKDGNEFPAEIFLSALKTEEGLIVSAAIRDVSHRRQAEAEIEAARREFLGRVSHELRTPLNAILGFAQLLELDHPVPGERNSVRHILSAGRHLLALVDEILDIGRIEAGRLDVSLEPVPVAETVHETVELVAPLATERGVALQIDDDGRDTLVVADRQRLRQVLLNLASNAVKYNRPGGRVGISWATHGTRVRVRVLDTGVGIRAEAMGRLFVPFERLATAETHVEGTGLGLALSKGLVEAMGGRIWAESEHQVGSTFWMELDRSNGHVRAPSGQNHSSPQSPDQPRARILYVGDSLPTLRLVEQVLGRRYRAKVIATLQGSLALELARQHRPDVILLDPLLPDIPGEEVLHRLRAEASTSAIPVVLLIADATPRRVSHLMMGGTFGYVTKPLHVSRFLELVEDALHRADTGRPARGRQTGGGPGQASVSGRHRPTDRDP
jgi:PAS domain S-box-containing protein